MKRKQKHFLFALTSTILLSAIPYCSISAEVSTHYGEIVSTTNAQNYYGNWSNVSTSYLAVEGNEYLRVSGYLSSNDDEYDLTNSINKIAIERYNNNFEIQSVSYLDTELPLFGGFYSSENFYYLVFGQENKNERDDAEVIRIVKYDKSWNRIASASLNGANTTVPFDAGNLRFAEYNGYLYIRTSHEMYTSEDGLNHQSNLTIEVRESDMKVVDSFYNVLNSDVGYVSHSFNQFIIVDDHANLVALDHGDAYPRSALLGKYDTKAGQETFLPNRKGYTNFSLLDYKGSVGDNYTGATIGGLEYSDTCYLTAGSSIVQDENYKNHKTQNIYITTTKKDSFRSDSTAFSWITNYEEGGDISASTPILVKKNNNSFVLLWSQLDENYKNTNYTISTNGKISYVFLDGEGKTTSPIYVKDGYLSDCQPVVNNDGNIIWYVLENGNLSFYSLEQDGNLTIKPVTPTLDSVTNVKEGVEIKWKSVPNATKYRLYRDHVNEDNEYKLMPLIDTIDNSTSYIDTTVSSGETYTYSIKSLDPNGNEMHANLDHIGKEIWYESIEDDLEPNENNKPSNSNTTNTDTSTNKILEISSIKMKSSGKKLTAIKGKISVKNAIVKIKIGNGKFKKAKVTGKNFFLKLVPKANKNTIFTVKATKPGYKTVKRYVTL